MRTQPLLDGGCVTGQHVCNLDVDEGHHSDVFVVVLLFFARSHASITRPSHPTYDLDKVMLFLEWMVCSTF